MGVILNDLKQLRGICLPFFLLLDGMFVYFHFRQTRTRTQMFLSTVLYIDIAEKIIKNLYQIMFELLYEIHPYTHVHIERVHARPSTRSHTHRCKNAHKLIYSK